MAENIGLTNSLSIYSGARSYNTFFSRLLTKNVLERMNHAIYPFTEQSVENDLIEIATIDNSGKSIAKKGMSEWNRLTTVLNTNKKNIILLLTEPLSFSRSQEEQLFLDAISKSRFEGKNILVVYRGEKTGLVTLKDGVRVISLAYDSASLTNFMKQPTEALKIYYNNSQMTYEIISEPLFSIH